jgi:hypothetical protein
MRLAFIIALHRINFPLELVPFEIAFSDLGIIALQRNSFLLPVDAVWVGRASTVGVCMLSRGFVLHSCLILCGCKVSRDR